MLEDHAVYCAQTYDADWYAVRKVGDKIIAAVHTMLKERNNERAQGFLKKVIPILGEDWGAYGLSLASISGGDLEAARKEYARIKKDGRTDLDGLFYKWNLASALDQAVKDSNPAR